MVSRVTQRQKRASTPKTREEKEKDWEQQPGGAKTEQEKNQNRGKEGTEGEGGPYIFSIWGRKKKGGAQINNGKVLPVRGGNGSREKVQRRIVG